MKAADAARRAGVSVKALRYYESSGLIFPERMPNGYRDYSEADAEAVRQITELTALGLSVNGTRPFVDCLRQGNAAGDDCVESLDGYRREIERVDALIAQLTVNRERLAQRLDSAAERVGLAAEESDRDAFDPTISCCPERAERG